MCSRIVTSNRENHFTSVIISTIISTMLRVLQAFLLFFFFVNIANNYQKYNRRKSNFFKRITSMLVKYVD